MNCSVDECDRTILARGWCGTHYMRQYRGHEVGDAALQRQPQNGYCDAPNCGRLAKKRGLCGPCYKRANRDSFPGTASDRRDRREYQFQRRLADRGLTQRDYDLMLAAQGERCAICQKADPGGQGRWHVDHCHRTNVVRGLLCHNCNVGLGHFKDDPVALLAAIAYLKAVADVEAA